MKQPTEAKICQREQIDVAVSTVWGMTNQEDDKAADCLIIREQERRREWKRERRAGKQDKAKECEKMIEKARK